jgi:hypothetical protein
MPNVFIEHLSKKHPTYLCGTPAQYTVETSVDLKKVTAFTALFLRAVINNDFVIKGP